MANDDLAFLRHQHPYDMLPDSVCEDVATQAQRVHLKPGDDVYTFGAPLLGLYIIIDGQITVKDQNGAVVSVLQHGNTFGERGLLRDGLAATSARADTDAELFCLPVPLFHKLRADHGPFRNFFARGSTDHTRNPVKANDLTSVRVENLMIKNPVTCGPDMPIVEAARTLRDRAVSCLCVVEDDALVGILTVRDLSGKALAEDLPHDTPVREIMTASPRVLGPSAIGSDVLHLMMEHRTGHLPIVASGKLVGIVTQTDLTRFQASNAAGLVAKAARAKSVSDLTGITADIPSLLVQLVGAGHRHDTVTRLVTDVADVVTRKLLKLAEEKFGPPPARYLWLACGSQGRQEQTGVSDQDNCLILEDGISDEALAYFGPFAQFVSDGLNACGYVYCPGDMMATNPRWCQPVSVWREYFRGWIAQPHKEAQMLASVMFDLRPIGGDATLFDGVQLETLRAASENSIFTAHMASNALTHQTPLGLLRGFATIRSGEHRNTIDTKLNGVIPVVDLGRMYALQGQLDAVNTRARVKAALGAQVISASGGRDLLDAYDLIAQARLDHQVTRIKSGEKPDNFLPPASLSDFERSHLRDAFVVIKTMQSALMQGRGLLA